MRQSLTLLLCLVWLLLAACTPSVESGFVDQPTNMPVTAVMPTTSPDTMPADADPTDEAIPVEPTESANEASTSSSNGLPTACYPQAENAQTGPYVNLQDGYCFQYPVAEGFRVHDVFPDIGVSAVWGPPLTPNLEPIRAGLTVHKQEAVNGRSLDEIVATVLADNPEAQVVDAAATFAGEPAQIVEGISGMMDSRRYYLIHDGFLFEVTLVPLTQPGEFEEAVMAQRESLWQSVSSSFTWLPAETSAQFNNCPTPAPNGPAPESPFVDVHQGYCLLYPSYYGQQYISEQAQALFTYVTVTDPMQDIVTISILEPANGRSVQEVAAQISAAQPDAVLEQSETMLDGKPAIVVTGSSNRDLYTIHNDQVYHLHLDPLGSPDLETAWALITETFHFLP